VILSLISPPADLNQCIKIKVLGDLRIFEEAWNLLSDDVRAILLKLGGVHESKFDS
jgi:hypothetical protein